jgi:Cu/Ag efflux protein CusF
VKLWQVVLITDLALALGVGLGWVAWGRDVGRLSAELEVARSAPRPEANRWSGRGVVRGVFPEMDVLVITHEELPGFMPAMTMGFRAASAGVYRGVGVGDEIRFTVEGTPPAVAVTRIEKLR